MPTVIRKANGRLIIRSKGKRGFTTTQVTHEGEHWLREKFPASHYSLHELSIEWDVFRELARAGFLFREGSGRKWITGARRRRAAERSLETESDIQPIPVAPAPTPVPSQPTVQPPDRERSATPAAPPLAKISAAVLTRCMGCGAGLPSGAHFCPRCGRASRTAAQERDYATVFFVFIGVLVVAGVVCFLILNK